MVSDLTASAGTSVTLVLPLWTIQLAVRLGSHHRRSVDGHSRICRAPLQSFFLLVAVGKRLRYVVVALAAREF